MKSWRAGRTGAGLLLLLLLFWTASQLASPLPGAIALRISVHTLGFGDYGADPLRRLAPLSLRIVDDVRADAGQHPQLNSTLAHPSKASPSPEHGPTIAPSPVPPPTASPSATPTPTPPPTPTPAIGGGSSGSGSGGGGPIPTPTSTPTPTPTPTPAPTPSGKPGKLSGTVQDNATNNPVGGATVSLAPGGLTTTTSAKGTFTLASIPPGTYTMTVSAPGYSSSSQAVTINPGKKTKVTVGL